MEPLTLNNRPFTALCKLKAFARGLPYSPLTEVAREGIGKSFSLSPFEESRYAARLAEHGTTGFLCHVLGRGCSRAVQDIFASALRGRFEEKLRFMSAISYALWGAGHGISRFRDACRYDAQELAELRRGASVALASGNLTSGVAQAELVPVLRHYNIADGHFGKCVPELSGHEIPILSSPVVPEELKRRLIRELSDSRGIAAKGLLGLPLTPYDTQM
jgi:hypothetical protein